MDTKVPFWPTPYPFEDFLVVAFKGAAVEDRIPAIQREASRLNLKVHSRIRFGSISSLVISSRTCHAKDRTHLTLLSGVAQLRGSFYFGQDSIKPSDISDEWLEQMCESVGIFTLLHADAHSMTITQDLFGCGTLFYIQERDFLVVSNRYHLLLLCLSWIGYRPRLDLDKVIGTIYSTNTFLHQNISSRMDFVGIFQLPLDKSIVIDEVGWRLVSKGAIRDLFAGCDNSEYEQLLLEGKEEVIANIKSVLECGRFSKYLADLSGGFDSRAVFAAILNIEDALKKIEVLTKDVPGDLEIAVGITNLFGARFYTEEPDAPQFPLTVRESLNIWRSYFMGTYYRLGIGAWSPLGKNISQIRFSGGVGEIYRTFWNKIFAKIAAQAVSAGDLVSRLTSSFAPLSPKLTRFKNRLDELLLTEINSLPGETHLEKFESHYLYFRNRYHFGMRAYEYYHDRPIWFPLMSKALFKASRCLSLEDRADRFMLEFTERLHPLLIWIDYASQPASDNKLLARISISDVRFKGCRVMLDSRTDAWKEMDMRNREVLRSRRPKMDDQFYAEWRDHMNIVYSDAIQAFYDIKNYSPELDALLDESILNLMERNLETNPRLLYYVYAKLYSLRDQLAIFS